MTSAPSHLDDCCPLVTAAPPPPRPLRPTLVPPLPEVVGVVPAEVGSPTATELSALLGRTVDGDHEAFALLHAATSRRAFGVAVRVTRDAARAEEVVQEAFLYVWQSADLFDAERGNAISWILMVVRGRALSRVRADIAREDREYGVHRRERPLVVDSRDVTSEAVLASADVDRLHAELELLPGAQRVVLELSFLGGHTYLEIAELTRVPLGTVKTRARGGLARLRRALDA